MASTLADLNAGFENLILEHFHATTPAAAGAPFFAFELGTPIPDETFHVPPEAVRVLTRISARILVTSCKRRSKDPGWALLPTGNTVDGQYEMLLAGSAPTDDASSELFAHIKRSALDAFDETLGSVIPPGLGRFHPIEADPINWFDQSKSDNWTILRIAASDTPQPGGGRPLNSSLINWQIANESVRSLLGERVSIRALQNAQFAQAAGVAAVASEAPVTERVNLTPRPGAGGAQSRERVTLNAALAVERSSLSRNSGVQRSIFRQIRDERAFFEDGRVDNIRRREQGPPIIFKPVSSDNFALSVEVSLVHLRRPWFSDGFLALKDWCIPSFERGEFSSGLGASDPGRLAVLPIACVFIRNLTIKATWTDADATNAVGSTHLGAFSLMGRTFDRETASLTIPGMQGIGWLCAPMPVLPPSSPSPN